MKGYASAKRGIWQKTIGTSLAYVASQRNEQGIRGLLHFCWFGKEATESPGSWGEIWTCVMLSPFLGCFILFDGYLSLTLRRARKRHGMMWTEMEQLAYMAYDDACREVEGEGFVALLVTHALARILLWATSFYPSCHCTPLQEFFHY